MVALKIASNVFVRMDQSCVVKEYLDNIEKGSLCKSQTVTLYSGIPQHIVKCLQFYIIVRYINPHTNSYSPYLQHSSS